MKKVLSLLLFVIFIFLTIQIFLGQVCDGQQVVLIQDGQCDYNPYVLVFEDNFEGNSLDVSRWQIQPWGQGALYGNGGNTQEYNSLDNVVISNGICKIIAKQESVVKRAISYLPDYQILSDGLPNSRTYNYTSSNIWSKYQFGYGKYEIRCKVTSGKGFWPAFWIYGEDFGSVNNEIDVFEFWDNNSSKHHMNVHYNGQMCETNYNGPDYSSSFHTFTVIWDINKIEWYVDGILKRRSTKYYTMQGQTVDCNGIHAFGQYIVDKIFPKDPMNIIANVAIQTGNYAPDNSTIFPNSMEIDYIKYYCKLPCVGELNLTEYYTLNSIYNFTIGTTITVGENFVVQNGQQLELVARDEIFLLPEFSSEVGSDFIARIEPNICYGIKNKGITSSDSTYEDSTPILTILNKPNTFNNISEINLKIKTYPNPNDGILSIEFEKDFEPNYELYLIDVQGKVVYILKSINDRIIEINMNGFSKGNYDLTIFDSKNKNMYVGKIILQ